MGPPKLRFQAPPQRELKGLINFDKNSELNIYDKNYGNEIFNTLKNEECDKLKELRLYNINISDISGLKGFRLEKLRKLGLNDNKIKNKSILKDIKFESLEELWLSNNTINDITVLEKCNLELLIKLDLSFNVISNINILIYNSFLPRCSNHIYAFIFNYKYF